MPKDCFKKSEMEEPFKIFGNFFRKLGQIFEPVENFSGSESFGQIPSFAFLLKNSYLQLLKS